ncbi:hypothetical protein SBA2_270095 [Acidobacteriia bacterium SbA2]|nr:hypothetical protein SBA2_270095 [Acidobacteriia bacterium SbA2]
MGGGLQGSQGQQSLGNRLPLRPLLVRSSLFPSLARFGLYRCHLLTSIGGELLSVMSQNFAEELSPQSGRQRVAHGASRGSRDAALTPVPSPAGGRGVPKAGEGCRRRGEGRLTQGLRPGLLYAAPDGALENGCAGERLS